MAKNLGSIKDHAERDGKATSREWVMDFSAQKFRQGRLVKAWNGVVNDGHPMAIAIIDYGRWIAACPFCGLYCGVDPDDDFFFCLYCAGGGTGEAGRVRFPPNAQAIENELLRRPIIVQGAHRSKADELLNAVPALLPRNWRPGQTVADLAREFDNAVKEHGNPNPPGQVRRL